MIPEFTPMPKMARLAREIIITEKIDGTNASIYISEDGKEMMAASRTRWITPEDDNYGFAKWVASNRDELLKLGPGHHFGEWWGQGIQRNYGQTTKKFSLFNVSRWSDHEARPSCCDVVPTLFQGTFNTETIENMLARLEKNGSFAAAGWMAPEGVVIFHTQNGTMFKKTLDDRHKEIK